jgi:LmbE family N-acetylglucosaminyl deacetylase
VNNNLYIPKRVMAIVAHPDDIEFGCAGTIARWVKEGAEAAYVLCTSGDVGIAEPGMTKKRAAEIREAEQIAAAEAIGVHDVVFLREPDGMLENTIDLRKRLVREIRRFRPEVVITGDPTVVIWDFGDMRRINHPDHRAASGAAIDAIFPASGQPNLFQELEEEGLKAHKVRKVYITGRGQGDVYVNISDVIDLRIEALEKHVSQIRDHDGLGDRIKEWTARTAAGKEMAHAESFRVVTLVSDEDWEKMQNP